MKCETDDCCSALKKYENFKKKLIKSLKSTGSPDGVRIYIITILLEQNLWQTSYVFVSQNVSWGLDNSINGCKKVTRLTSCAVTIKNTQITPQAWEFCVWSKITTKKVKYKKYLCKKYTSIAAQVSKQLHNLQWVFRWIPYSMKTLIWYIIDLLWILMFHYEYYNDHIYHAHRHC